MQADQIHRIQSRFSGHPACRHTTVEKVFESGAWTGKFGCAMCGELFDHRPKCAPAQISELIIVAGPGKGKKLVVSANGEYLLGSDSPSQVRLTDSGVSQVHCKLRSTDEGLFVGDLGSETGTLVNGSPIQEETLLRQGDILAIGPFHFQLADRSTSASTAPSTSATAATPTKTNSVESPTETDVATTPTQTDVAATPTETKAAERQELVARVYRRYGHTAVLWLSTPRIEEDNMEAVLQVLKTLFRLERGNRFVVNFTDVDHVLTRAIPRLIAISKELSDAGGGLWLCCLPPDLKELIVTGGLVDVLDISDHERSAVEALDLQVLERQTPSEEHVTSRPN